MSVSFGEPLTKLRAVPIRENGEPLVDALEYSRRLHFLKDHPRFIGMSRSSRVRKRVAEMLAEAAEALPAGTDFALIEGFRPLAQQRFMYESLKKDFAEKHPEWTKATLNRVTNQMSAPPDDRCPPPHLTGGAIDLCLIDAASGEMLDMWTPFAWNETSAPTDKKGLSETAHENRRLMVATLEKTGLTNYAGEWWHWSYGDSGWALRTNAPYALYNRLPDGEPGTL
jgi:D-alanyl-D-alanine dipeptidase